MTRKAAFITGGTRGLGKCTAEALAKEGFDLVINYRTEHEDTLPWIRNLQNTYNVKVQLVKGNLSNVQECKSVSRYVLEQVPHLNVLILNAGPYIVERKKLVDYTEEEWNELITGNLSSTFYILKTLMPVLRGNKGRIITFGFEKVESAPAWMYRSVFAAAKTGLASLTKTIALEEAPYGVTVNMICPGDITQDWKEKRIDQAKEIHDSSKPVGRPGTGEDISRMVVFLCDDNSDFITGSIFHVNGGQDVLSKSYEKL
ncbi:SDR family oxidoreductase [Bacillus carboniphilus]|uniref:SDR family oxidoreductase n=1 Tax=Bacillus carboniphilus TaxID=86663 RepID=A0ABN0WG06_9BACI